MRFAKWPRPTAYVETSRKRAAFVTKQRREREALLLFADMIAGGLMTRWPRPPSPNKPDNYGSHPGCEIASLAYHGTRPFTHVALVGGGLYLKALRAFLGGFREMCCITPTPRSPRSMPGSA